MKETELAEKVVSWLAESRWDVYQEVLINKSIADIVAVQGRLTWIIECKTSMSLVLIGQAIDRKRYANLVSVAVPVKLRDRSHVAANTILGQNGIGAIYVGYDDVHQSARPALMRKKLPIKLNDDQKTYALAGASGGGYWTPFKSTCRNIQENVRRNPGIILKEIIESTRHHYQTDSTARACISRWAIDGIIPGIECKRDGKFLRFYPKGK